MTGLFAWLVLLLVSLTGGDDDVVGEDELEEAMRSLGFTPAQRRELGAEPERAWGWIVWARGQRLANPPGTILVRFRTGEFAPNPLAWRGGAQGGAVLDYGRGLGACEVLVSHVGHEYEERELREELAAVCARAGGGAVLEDRDLARLLAAAGRMREARERELEAASELDRALAVRYYAGLIEREVLSEAQFRGLLERGRFECFGPEFAGDVVVAAECRRRSLEALDAVVGGDGREEGEGRCEDCARWVERRQRCGRVVLCRACVVPRLRVRAGVEEIAERESRALTDRPPDADAGDRP